MLLWAIFPEIIIVIPKKPYILLSRYFGPFGLSQSRWCTRTKAHLEDNGVDVLELDGARGPGRNVEALILSTIFIIGNPQNPILIILSTIFIIRTPQNPILIMKALTLYCCIWLGMSRTLYGFK